MIVISSALKVHMNLAKLFGSEQLSYLASVASASPCANEYLIDEAASHAAQSLDRASDDLLTSRGAAESRSAGRTLPRLKSTMTKNKIM